jgi:hypothetical protein
MPQEVVGGAKSSNHCPVGRNESLFPFYDEGNAEKAAELRE